MNSPPVLESSPVQVIVRVAAVVARPDVGTIGKTPHETAGLDAATLRERLELAMDGEGGGR